MIPSLVALSLALAPAPRPQVYVEALIASVDADFAAKIGWTKPDSCRTDHGAMTDEIHTLVRAAKAAEKIDVLSRPSLMLEPDQEGYFCVAQSGHDTPEGLQIRTTAAVMAGGAIKLKVDTKYVERNPPLPDGTVAFDTEQVQATVTVSAGATACLRIGTEKGKKAVRLAFVTAHAVRAVPAAAAPDVDGPPGFRLVQIVSEPVRNPFVAKPAAEPAPCPTCPAAEPTTLAELLTAYRAACDRQDAAAATRLAVKALALDPTCFK